jgi:hypothetical protein
MTVNQKTDLTVSSYKAASTPSSQDVPSLIEYLIRELQRLQRTIADLVNAANQATDVAPKDPRNGMVRYAEGAWGTALGGTGFYGYKAGVWTRIV